MNKGRFMKVTLVCMFLFLILFTVSCLYIAFITQSEPSTLIACVFAFCGAEGGLMAWIKNTKEKKGKVDKNENQLETEVVE